MKKVILVFSLIMLIFLQTVLLALSGMGAVYAAQTNKKIYEAENATSNGIIINSGSIEGVNFSNQAYMLTPNQYIEFSIDVETEGFYSIDVSFYGYFQGKISLDQDQSYTLYISHPENTIYSCAQRILISKGAHKIKFKCDEKKGYCAID